MKQNKCITAKHSLKELLSLTNTIYQLRKKDLSSWKNLLKKENLYLQNLDIDTIINNIELLHQIYPLDDYLSLKNDIDNFTTFNPIIERVNYNLEQEFYKKIKCKTTDTFSKTMFDTMIKRQSILNKFIYELRTIFIHLLENHILSSNCMSKDYKDTLNQLFNNLKFKYTSTYLIFKDTEDYIEQNLRDSYMHSLIDELIKEIIAYQDSDLEDDITYAKVMAYQTLLRSLLIMLDNYELLAEYEELYNKLERKETIAKNIIKSAFISNYSDLSTYKKTKILENLYEQN